MKSTLLLSMLALSLTAQADYFNCHLKVGEDAKLSTSTDYNVYEASISSRGWTCEGRMEGNVAKVKLTGPWIYGMENGEVTEGLGFSQVEYRDPLIHDMPDLVATCLCGME